MSLTPQSASTRRKENPGRTGIFSATNFAHLFRFPILTESISGLTWKNALLMILLCAPALLLCGMLIIPGLLFQLPEQNAYYHFSRVLNQDPSRLVVLAITGFFALIALAIPGSASKPGMISRQ